ncbi:MAG: PIN domain-containing protein [Clostridia bacterium]|nr:PIN domain-containing protein [Clostridia bacterium]
MNIFVDTNVLLDVLGNRQPFAADSSKVWKLGETLQVRGFISVLSVPNIVYILRRELSAEKAEEIVRSLLLIFEPVELTADDVLQAAAMRWDDYEDALQAAAAKNAAASYIITRNTADFERSAVPAITPQEFLRLLSER